MTVLVSKKDRQDQSQNLFGGGNYKKNQKKKQQTQQPVAEKNNEIQPIQHNFDMLQGFEKLGVLAPDFVKQIDETLKQLQEKKQYYEELPNKEQ